jgi:hypothetical protein
MGERIKTRREKSGVGANHKDSRTNKSGFQPADSNYAAADRLLQLQRTVGNREVTRLIRSGVLQTRLKIGQPGDIYEKEADRAADRIMCMPEPGCPECLEAKEQGIQREIDAEKIEKVAELILNGPLPEEEGTVQAKQDGGRSSGAAFNVESHINGLRGGGHPLPESTRSFFEPRFGADFSQVRIHTCSTADRTAGAINARAFTKGQDIVFAANQYAPGTTRGKRLLAHELTHVVQQNSYLQRSPLNRKTNRVEPLYRYDKSVEINQRADHGQISRHTVADCEERYERCCDRCRALPPNAKRRRALCWAQCMTEYAACLATAVETLTFAAIVAAIVLAAADGPFPIGDAAAAALLLALGITGS